MLAALDMSVFIALIQYMEQTGKSTLVYLLKIPRIAKQDLGLFFFFLVLCSEIQFELVKSGLHEADK